MLEKIKNLQVVYDCLLLQVYNGYQMSFLIRSMLGFPYACRANMGLLILALNSTGDLLSSSFHEIVARYFYSREHILLRIEDAHPFKPKYSFKSITIIFGSDF